MHSLQLAYWIARFTFKNRKQLLLFCLVLPCIIWLISSQKSRHFLREVNVLTAQPCSDNDAKDVVEKICSLYKNNEITGDLCQPLCDQELVQFVRCLNYKQGKHVMQVTCANICTPGETVNAVLKMAHVNVSDFQQHFSNVDDDLLSKIQDEDQIRKSNIHENVISARSLSILTHNLLETEYGLTPRTQDVLHLLWNNQYGNYFHGPNTSLVFARSFWSVVLQNEYRISKVFSEWDVFPAIYGSCGTLYMVENSPGLKPFNTILSYFMSGYPSWKIRAEMAISILNLVHQMEVMEHPLHLCDVKSPHFGVTSNNKVRFIDADTVFTEQALNRVLGGPKCSTHEDCAYFDCNGWCLENVGKCSPVRTNNNLQMVCANIFQGDLLSTSTGLLLSPPAVIAKSLTNLVNSCAENVTGVTPSGIVVKQPDLAVLTQLVDELLKSLKS